MKFFSKLTNSQIIKEGLRYTRSNTNNQRLKELLVAEQYGFCAYTEKYLSPLESAEVEHFNSALKYNDDYYNYYAVIRTANLYKQDEKYDQNALFFTSKFFQDRNEFDRRIGFESNIYFEKEENDIEARDFIDFLNLNHPKLSEERKNHISKLRDVFSGYDNDKIYEHFEKYPEDLSFVTAVEKEFNANFETIIINN